jgi:hypothetical protein
MRQQHALGAQRPHRTGLGSSQTCENQIRTCRSAHFQTDSSRIHAEPSAAAGQRRGLGRSERRGRKMRHELAIRRRGRAIGRRSFIGRRVGQYQSTSVSSRPNGRFHAVSECSTGALWKNVCIQDTASLSSRSQALAQWMHSMPASSHEPHQSHSCATDRSPIQEAPALSATRQLSRATHLPRRDAVSR